MRIEQYLFYRGFVCVEYCTEIAFDYCSKEVIDICTLKNRFARGVGNGLIDYMAQTQLGIFIHLKNWTVKVREGFSGNLLVVCSQTISFSLNLIALFHPR